MVALRCNDYGSVAVHASDDAGSRGNVLEGALLIRRPREVNPLGTDPGAHDYLRHNIMHSLLTAGCMVTTVSPLPEEALKLPVAKNGRPYRPHNTHKLHRQRRRSRVFLGHFVAQPPHLFFSGRYRRGDAEPFH
ncbi:hypothetical protein MTO96_016909 [Rhipicephalus appendiculatus]